MAQDLFQVVSARSQELLLLVAHEIERSHIRALLPAGIVITGGGSLLKGLSEQASAILRLPVRIGLPHTVTSTSTLHHPMHATGFGIIMHILRQRNDSALALQHGPLTKRIFSKMRSWLGEIF